MGQVGRGVLLGQLAVNRQRFVVGPLGLFHAIRVAVEVRQIVQRAGHVGQVGRGVLTWLLR